MQRTRAFRSSLMMLFALAVWLAPAAASAGEELRALFIGNSLTFVNDLPGMLAELAKAGRQKPLYHDQETPGGCNLEKHWKDGKALAKIRSGRWDYVVLQEEGHGPITS